MDLLNRTTTEFTELVASPAPAPGGGGASALAAAVGAALADMVGELTVDKKRYADVEEEVKALMEQAQALLGSLPAVIVIVILSTALTFFISGRVTQGLCRKEKGEAGRA